MNYDQNDDCWYKLGIIGGTFDPIHFGHLISAETVREKLKLEQIIFIPAGKPPHKTDKKITDSQHRYNMVVKAVEDNPFFAVSDLEIKREGFSYTVDTISYFKSILPQDTELFFIVGSDAILELHTWKEPERLLTLCQFVVMTRPGYQNNELFSLVDKYNQNKFVKGIKIVEVPYIEISSTLIRNRVKNGLSITYLVPEKVEKYIREHGLYL
ncbi:MAG TPA: nicotinate-nucleotide adenylyltransferase [Clostridia bacterium]|nr:nicotinate-nucleotide adenylyltransferase [Clostridia bacterium]